MRPRHYKSWNFGLGLCALALATLLHAQEKGPLPRPVPLPLPASPAEDGDQRPRPIDLPSAMRLANASPLDIALATQRLQAASAQLDRANVLWLPTIYLGGDYFRHDGQLQDIAGRVFTTSRSSIMLGAGPSAVFALSDAIYAPLAARQVVSARHADIQAVRNDTLLQVAEAYFNVQQARGDLAGSLDTVRKVEDLVRRVEKLTPGLAPAVEVNRARTELARRRQGVETGFERWQVAGAELTRILRLEQGMLVSPVEEPHLRVEIVDVSKTVDELIPVALSSRPELAANQALVQATLARLKQERIRPLVPSILIRGNATNPAGTLSSGYFGGGLNSSIKDFTARNSVDFQMLWELQNLGFGNRAAVRERRAEKEAAMLELFRTQDRVAADVTQAHAQARRSLNRLVLAEDGLRNALETADKNLEGLSQTRRAGEFLVLVFRPQEVVAAIQSLDQAYRDYYLAVADSNRAQFRLYRALGNPAQCIEPNLLKKAEGETKETETKSVP